MANNRLRRDILDFASRGGATVDPMSADTLLSRALAALGGPVSDSRPVPEVPEVEIRAELPEPEPLPEGPQPDPVVIYHGIELFLRVKHEVVRQASGVRSFWVRTTWGVICDVTHCLRANIVPHGPYHFCNNHFGQLMDNIAKEHAADAGELDAYQPGLATSSPIKGIGSADPADPTRPLIQFTDPFAGLPKMMSPGQAEAFDRAHGLTKADVDPATAILPADLGPKGE